MPLDIAQREWLTSISGLAIAHAVQDKKRNEKDARSREMGVKVGLAKETIRSEFDIKLKKKGLGSGIKVLDEKGTQFDEYDISDYDNFEMKQEYLAQMSDALAKVERIAKEMREAMTEKIDEATGEPVKGKDGKPIMVPLYTDEEIAEEVYMPLVRERLMPESLVPGKFSKTQEMIDATDKLYKERLDEYTKATESDGDFLDDVKMFADKLGGIAERATKLFPGGEEAATIISLTKLSFTTTITAYQVIKSGEMSGMGTQVIDNIGKIAGGIIGAAVNPETGKLVTTAYSVAVTGPKMAIHLCQDPPRVQACIEELATGIESAVSMGIKNPTPTQTALTKAMCKLLESSANIPAIREAILNGERDKVIDGFANIAKGMLSASTNLASVIGDDVDPQELQSISSKVNQGLDVLTKGVKFTATIIDAAKAKKIDLMTQQLVDGFGEILTGAVGTFASPDIAKQCGSAYSATTSVGMVAYYLTLETPDQGAALRALAKGFTSSLGLALGDSDPNAAKIGAMIEKAIITAGNGYDLAKAIKEDKYGEAVKKLQAIATGVVNSTFGAAGKEGGEDVTSVMGEISGLAQEIAKVKDKLKSDQLEEELAAKVMELRGQQALEEMKSSQEDVRRLLVQRDESGSVAAEARSIDALIAQMMKDRMMIELATKLVSGGVGVVAKFVPALGPADAAIQLAINLMKATQRAMELNKWINNQKDMKAAQSCLTSSSQNFVKNQAEQFSHYSIQAACKLAQMIGEIVKCSGLCAAAGQAVSTSAALAAEAEDVMYTFYKKVDLELAWKATKKAFDHPESRKLALIARSMNPTLAKYSIAWGATVKKDALAMEAMATCGINELTLSDPGSNVKKVQQYLELMFNEDNVVLKRVVVPKWMPDKVELTVRCWGVAKAKGVKDADLLNEATGAIDESIARCETLKVEVLQVEKIAERSESIDDIYEDLQDKRKRYAEALAAAQSSLSAWRPKTVESGTLHHEMQELMGEFRDLADTDQVEVELAIATTESESDGMDLRRLFKEKE